MHTKEEKNTSTMPLLGWETEDKIYVHPESGDKIEFVYHNETREDMDFEVQKAIKFLNDCVCNFPNDDFPLYKKEYDSTIYLLYRLKDCLWLMRKEDPTAFRQMNRKDQSENYG